MLKQIQEVEFEKMKQLREILENHGASKPGEMSRMNDRIERLEKQGEETKEKLDAILGILQAMQPNSHAGNS